MSKKKYYLPTKDADRALWFDNFYQKLLLIYLTLGILPLVMTNLLLDLNAYKYTLVLASAVKAYARNVNAYKKAMNNGFPSGATPPFPVFVMPPLPPTAVNPGIFNRIIELVKVIKAASNYSEAIGLDLDIIGADINPDYVSLKPKITLNQSGINVIGKIPKKHTEAVKYLSKRGTETDFTYLATIVKGNLMDGRPNLVPGTPEVRNYQAWYLMDNDVVGIISDITSITV